jgi:hypothetical protein
MDERLLRLEIDSPADISCLEDASSNNKAIFKDKAPALYTAVYYTERRVRKMLCHDVFLSIPREKAGVLLQEALQKVAEQHNITFDGKFQRHAFRIVT